MPRLRPLCSVLLLLSVAWLTACTSTATPTPAGSPDSGPLLQGTVRVSGAWALYPMMVRWGEEFSKLHPAVRVDVSAGGAGKGIADALARMVDLGMVSRDIKPEEIAQGAAYVPVAKDAVFAAVSQDNPALPDILAHGVTRETLVALWIDGLPMTWGQLSGGTSDRPVQVYTRSDACGAAEAWAKYLGKAQEDLAGTAVYGDPGLAEAVRTDALAIGYNNLNYAYDLSSGLPVQGMQVVPIDVNGNGKVDPEEDVSNKEKAIRAIQAGVYPSPPARDLNLVTRDQFDGLTREFVRWILTDGQAYLGEVGYIAPTESLREQALQMIGQ